MLRRGVAALGVADARMRAALPPSGRAYPSLLRDMRELQGLALRLEMELEFDGLDAPAVHARDVSLSMAFDDDDIERLERLVPDAGEERAALVALVALLTRYQSGEFMPPDSYFGITEPDA